MQNAYLYNKVIQKPYKDLSISLYMYSHIYTHDVFVCVYLCLSMG